MFAFITAHMLQKERAAIGTAAAQHAENIATTLQSDIEHAVNLVDSALNDVRVGLPLVEKQSFAPVVQSLILFDTTMRQSEYGAVLVTNDRGAVTFDSRSTAPRKGDFADREWFKVHRTGSTADLAVSLDDRGLSERPVIAFSRGLRRADGSFAGVAVATLDLSFFRNAFGSLHLGTGDDVIISMSDGRSIFRRSTEVGVFGAVAKLPAVSDAAAGYLVASRSLQAAPLVLTVSLSTDEIFAAWRSEALIVGLSVAVLLLCACLLALRLRRELGRREKAEAETRESETKFKLLADNASDMISRVDQFGERDYVSPAAERLLGVPPEMLLGRALWDYIDPRDRGAVAEMRDALECSSTPLDASFRVHRSDGQQRWVEALARPITSPITRGPGGYVSAWRDITDRKNAEIRLGENEARYRALAENASDVITSLDLDLNRTYVSPSARTVLGYEPDELLGKRAAGIVHPEDRSDAVTHLRRLQSGETDREVLTCRLRHRAGHHVWIEGKMSLVRDPSSGVPTSILCSIRDISERRAQQETLVAANLGLERLSRHLAKARDAAEQANKAKSRFLANVSHELRTPLNGILGYTQLLQIEGGLSPKQAARVDAMTGAGRHLLEMINGVLDLSEIEAGHFGLRPVSTDTVGLAEACLDLVRPTAEGKALRLDLQLQDQLPRRIVVDPTRLRQILLNLLGNAVKYTGSGEVRLRLGSAAGSGIRFEIADTGPGIANDRRHRLFQDFERLGVDTVSEVEGAGIGLALSYRLATAMGGRMGHDDNQPGGSVFWFELPDGADDPATTTVPREDSCENPPPEMGRLRVLVVDDVAVNRDVAASFLVVAGHEATCANSGEEAVAMAAVTEFDLILMDVRMPGIGGLEATRQIRALPGHTASVPIAALTAQAFAEEVAACLAAGMDAHLTKPFTQAALAAVLGNTIELNRRRSSGAASCIAADAMQPAEPSGLDLHAFHAPAGSTEAIPTMEVGFDLNVFRLAVETLPANKLATHLRTLVSRAELLQVSLRALDTAKADNDDLDSVAAAAHALAGSAGVFGFTDLSAAAREFEYATCHQSGELPKRRDQLSGALDAARSEMENRYYDAINTAGLVKEFVPTS